MLGSNTKKLIIVVDKKTNVYGELLSALISMKDDKAEGDNVEIVGVEDGSVDAAIWDVKVYSDNQSQLGSAQKIIYIGKNDASKPVMQNIDMTNDYSKYGVFFGSLGNKAVIFADDKPLTNKELYDEFIDSYSTYINEIGQEYSNKEISATRIVQDVVDERKSKLKGVLNKGLNGIKNVPEKVIPKRFSPQNDDREFKTVHEEVSVNDKTVEVVDTAVQTAKHIILPVAIAETVQLSVVRVKSAKEIRDQQYRCGVVLFYMNQLAKFLE